jgi:hypothetical protein
LLIDKIISPSSSLRSSFFFSLNLSFSGTWISSIFSFFCFGFSFSFSFSFSFGIFTDILRFEVQFFVIDSISNIFFCGSILYIFLAISINQTHQPPHFVTSQFSNLSLK